MPESFWSNRDVLLDTVDERTMGRTPQSISRWRTGRVIGRATHRERVGGLGDDDRRRRRRRRRQRQRRRLGGRTTSNADGIGSTNLRVGRSEIRQDPTMLGGVSTPCLTSARE
jgi:hypothetical protein